MSATGVLLGVFVLLAQATNPAVALAGQGADGGGQRALGVDYFYSPTCMACARAKPAVDAAQQQWSELIDLRRHDVQTVAGMELMLQYERQSGAPHGVPKVFVGSQYLTGADEIIGNLDRLIAEQLDRPRNTAAPGPDPAAQPPAGLLLLERFSAFRATTVAMAGLLDGINPCAFTTIVFLLSMLAYLGRSKRQLAAVGVSFTVAVFVTYLLLGLGLLVAIKTFAVSRGVSLALTYVVAGLAFVFAGWSAYDAVRFIRSGKVPPKVLGLPRWSKRAIHVVIRTGLRTPHLVVGSFVVGLLVALLESFCTGQVYLPTIMLVVRTPSMRLHALAYLLLYNLMFILPLAAIMAVAYWGLSSDRLGQLVRRHLGVFKIALAVLFAGLGALLLATA